MDGQEIGRRIDELRRELDALSAAAVEGAAPTEASQPMPKRARRRVRRSIVFAVLLVTLAIPGVVLASHQFSDVPNSNTFHNSISNIKIAGITGGCGGSKYCPSDPVTRGQMAAFLNRGLMLFEERQPFRRGIRRRDRLRLDHRARALRLADARRQQGP